MSVVIETTIGDITVDLFTEERPIACLNFIKLCKLKYYNYNLFHTVQQGFIAQTGDPTGEGDGGCSIWGVVEGQHKRFFEGESLPKIRHSTAGLLSMVGVGKYLVGSQFFFTLADNLISLDGQHCVIGEVVEGLDVLRKFNESIVDGNFRPYQDIRITHTVILDDPFLDPRGFRGPSRSPTPSVERLRNGRIAADEDIDDTDGKTMEEIQEMLEEREAKARATILEIVGDLPDADMAPPENVLFVCKLNPVTTDDDLEIIFSRFGRVKCCEVIRDCKSGDSLQYAFVEFEEQKSCEAAYFKMDNVLIDDRRIHVDFSQSVSRIKWKGKGRGIEGDVRSIDFNNFRNKREDYNGERKANNRTERQHSPRRGSKSLGKSTEERSRRNEREKRKRTKSPQRNRNDYNSYPNRRQDDGYSQPWRNDDRRYVDGHHIGTDRQGRRPCPSNTSRSQKKESPERNWQSKECNKRRSREIKRRKISDVNKKHKRIENKKKCKKSKRHTNSSIDSETSASFENESSTSSDEKKKFKKYKHKTECHSSNKYRK